MGKKIERSEITPEHLYLSRRKFMIGIGSLAASTLLLSACERAGITPPDGGSENATPDGTGEPSAGDPNTDGALASAETDELGAPLTSYENITNYNNYYEYTLHKEDVAYLARDLETSPWDVAVGGLVKNPRIYTMKEILDEFPQEERIYRLRCVEAWSMVVPWLGFPLASLLNAVEPTEEAKYVRFETLYDPEQMPGQKSGVLDWPYIEGLRLDEAMNDLTILATGLYGKPLPPQDGAPLRLVVPWKYGFKYIKSIVKIDLVEEMPESAWMKANSREYGFYANVNPEVPHPRWAQSSERRIGQGGRIKTLPFNGYADEVAHLYEGMDPKTLY